MHRRLQLLERQPADERLRRAVAASMRGLTSAFPALVGMAGWNAECFINEVADVIVTLEEQLRSDRILHWSACVADDAPARRRFVIERAALQQKEMELQAPLAARDVVTCSAVHPGKAVEEAALAWGKLWSGEGATLDPDGDFDELLTTIPQAGPWNGEIRFDGVMLQKLADKLIHKAAGPDCWDAALLRRMPSLWWSSLAELWAVVYRTACVPARWTEARIALVPKPRGGLRPLGITSVAWRLGARAVVQQIRSWIVSWSNHRSLGGLPHRAVHDFHLRFAALFDEDGCFTTQVVSQDLEKFFDTLDVGQASAVLSRIGAPEQWVSLLRAFYRDCRRIFAVKGVYNQAWSHAKRGLIQGCPFSAVVAAAAMHLWASFVCDARCGVDGAAFLDDRMFWRLPDGPGDALGLALQRSDRFDRCFGLRLCVSKCRVAALDPDSEQASVLDSFGYGSVASCLEVLGVDYDLRKRCEARPLRNHVMLARRRLRLIRHVAPCRAQRCLLIASLVLPMFTWVAGWAQLAPSVLDSLRTETLLSYGGRLPCEVPPCLLLEHLGRIHDPVFATAWRALRAATRIVQKVSATLEDLSLEVSLLPWYRLVPGAREIADKLGWRTIRGGLARRDDDDQVRTFLFGIDSPGVLFDWLVEAFRVFTLQRCGRIAHSLHRQGNEAGTAKGLALPRPRQWVGCFDAHIRAFRDAGLDKDLRYASLAVGCSYWHHFGRKKLPFGDARQQCLCNGTFPSRAHLVWACDSTAGFRGVIRQPQDRAEERLFLQCTGRCPAPPQPVLGDDERLVEAVLAAVPAQGQFCVATDGSSDKGIAAWAVHFPSGSTSVASLVAGEDHTAFRAEAEGALHLLQALVAVTERGVEVTEVDVLVFMDCLSVLELLWGQWGSVPLLADRLHGALLRARAVCRTVTFAWVPSHGKIKPGWHPPEGLCEVAVRAWNASADWAAKEVVRREAADSLRGQWHLQRQEATRWSSRVLGIVCDVARRYRLHADSLD